MAESGFEPTRVRLQRQPVTLPGHQLGLTSALTLYVHQEDLSLFGAFLEQLIGLTDQALPQV